MRRLLLDTNIYGLIIEKKEENTFKELIMKVPMIVYGAINHLKIDFLLVSCATLNKLDLIISEDHKTMLSLEAIRTYHFVNGCEDLKLPTVFTYEELKLFLKRLSLS